MRKYRIYVGAGVLIFALVLSYFAYHKPGREKTVHCIFELFILIIFKIPEAQKKQYPFPF